MSLACTIQASEVLARCPDWLRALLPGACSCLAGGAPGACGSESPGGGSAASCPLLALQFSWAALPCAALKPEVRSLNSSSLARRRQRHSSTLHNIGHGGQWHER